MVINGIDTQDISVVVQGAVDQYITPLCLASIREHLPGAEIILSTWEGTDVQGLDCDQLVLSKDPGTFDNYNREYAQQNEFEREIVSTVQGLRCAQHTYCAKMRTDNVFVSAGFLHWFDKFPQKSEKYSFFRHRIIACQYSTSNPRASHSEYHYALNPSGYFYFGLKDDLIDLYDVPSIPEEDKTYFARKYPTQYVDRLPRYTAEQYLWMGFLRKHIDDDTVFPKDSEDNRKEIRAFSEASFAANLILLSNEQIGIRYTNSSIISQYNKQKDCLSHKDWRSLYERYSCGKHIRYLIFRGRTALNSHLRNIISVPERIAQKTRDYLLNRVKPYLSQQEKERLKPLYFKLKNLYFKFSLKPSEKNYIESYFNETVTDADISVVVQGAISSATKECLHSIRRILPRAEVILSTWEGADVTDLDYDKVILNHDPGSNGLIRRFPHPQIHNVNRIIISSREGIKAAERRYCMKIRSDMRIDSDAFLKYYNQYSQYISPDAPVYRRIMAEGLASNADIDFAVSDWWYFGLRHDIEKLFDIPLAEVEKTPYFEREENKEKKPEYADVICRYIPEAYIIYQFLRKYSPDPKLRILKYGNVYDRSALSLDISRRFMAGSMLFVEFTKSGVILPKANNIASESSFNYCLPLPAFLNLCKSYYTLPRRLLKLDRDSVREYEAHREKYRSASRFYDIEQYANIVGNYAKINHLEDFEVPTIRKEDITFVVAGKVDLDVDNQVTRCLSSIRRFFPESKIILSTWKNSDLEDVEKYCDELVLLEEPRKWLPRVYMNDQPAGKRLTIDLQQISVHAGLMKVKTKYAVRMRTDHYLINDNLFRFYNTWAHSLNKTDGDYRVFSERVLVSLLFTFDTRGYYKPYGISDCFQFGSTEDLLKLWDGHSEPLESTNYFNMHSNTGWSNPERFNHRYVAEQYFFLSVLRKAKLNILLPEYYLDHSSDRLVFEPEKVFASNILIGDNMQLGLRWKFTDEQYDGLRLNRLLELYLYNIDPRNESCLAYLQEQYTQPPAKKGSAIVSVLSVTCKVFSTCVRTAADGMKRIMRAILPAYRVSVGIRERLMAFETEEINRFNHLIDRINTLEDSKQQSGSEIKRLTQKQKRRTKGRRNDIF